MTAHSPIRPQRLLHLCWALLPAILLACGGEVVTRRTPLTAASIEGAGLLRVNGGDLPSASGETGAGAGGRIYLHITNSDGDVGSDLDRQKAGGNNFENREGTCQKRRGGMEPESC